jgi:hypothetical protein
MIIETSVGQKKLKFQLLTTLQVLIITNKHWILLK